MFKRALLGWRLSLPDLYVEALRPPYLLSVNREIDECGWIRTNVLIVLWSPYSPHSRHSANGAWYEGQHWLQLHRSCDQPVCQTITFRVRMPLRHTLVVAKAIPSLIGYWLCLSARPLCALSVPGPRSRWGN